MPVVAQPSNDNSGVPATTVWTISAIELFLLPATIGIAALNFKVIFQTSVVHRNLRFALLVQSFMIMWWSCSQIHLLIWKMLHGDPYAFGSTLVVTFDSFAIQYLTLMSHVLIIERILATILVSSYENWRSPVFSIVWFVGVTSYMVITSVIVYEMNIKVQTFVAMPLNTVILDTAVMIISFLEIIAIAKLGLYNAKKYAQSVFYSGVKRTLSERYQLSENIRTNRQLGPIFVAHFIQLLFLALVVYSAYFNLLDIAGQSILVHGYFLGHASANIVIVFVVIMFHPALQLKIFGFRRRLRRVFILLHYCFCCREMQETVEFIATSNSIGAMNNEQQAQHIPMELIGAASRIAGNGLDPKSTGLEGLLDETALHFKTLEMFWAMPDHDENTAKSRKRN